MDIDALKLIAPVEPKARMMNVVVAESASPVVEPISLERAKEHLRVVFEDEDAYIASLITAARQMAEGRLNRTLARRQLVATFGSWNSIVLLKPPIVSIDAIEYLDYYGETQPLEGYRFLGGRFSFVPGITAPQVLGQPEAITVRYTAGYAEGEIPAPIIQWMLLSIGTMYENRESIINGVSSAPLADDFAKWLLQPHRVYE